MNSNSSMFQNSAHRDVLSAPIPESESSKRGLLEELKNRGRSAVGGKAWPDAQMLYEKALEVVKALPEGDNNNNNQSAILHSNLSLCLAKMGKFQEAKDSATNATKQDETYVKGWWRLSQALSSMKKYSEAVEAMEKALALDPNNKALQKECAKLQEEAAKAPVEEEKKETGPKTEPAPPRSEIYKAKDPATKKKTTTAPAAAPTTTTTTSNNGSDPKPMDVDDEDKGLFTQSDAVRGYKIVNGKKTSYFHNELTEEAKQLIGDIAPKKLDSAPTPTPTAQSGDKSAWNQAGTWEERDVTSWAKTSLKEVLAATTYEFPESSPAPGAIAKISTVKKVDGHASYATVRNKKRYIYEFTINLEWVLDVPGTAAVAKGKLNFPDVDGTCELGDGYEATFEITALEDPSLRPVVDRFVKSQGLRDSLHQTIDDWVRAFREKC